jgi:hypothetical protein
MESTAAKFARAVEHFESFNRDSTAFINSIEHNIVLKHDPRTGAKWLVFWDSDCFPPIRLSTIVGDVLFNLRSALDNCVCGLVLRRDPHADCSELQFPICSTDDQFDKSIKRGRLAGVPDHAIRFIRSVQPMHAPENNRPLHPLSLIHDLNNRDKHRSAHITTGATRGAEVVLLSQAGEPLLHVRVPDAVEGGPSTVAMPSSLPDAIRVRGGGSFRITFRREADLQDRPVVDVLAACINHVETQVLHPMRHFFERSTS